MANNGSIHEIRKKVTFTYELISTSYHEAGHALFALLNHRLVESVVVFENKKSKRIDGFTYYHSPDLSDSYCQSDPDTLRELLNVEIGIKYAGLTAEKYHFKKLSGSDKFPLYWRDGSSDDTLSAANLIKKYSPVAPGRKRYAYKKKIIKQTLNMLDQHWEAVTLVAHALIQKKKLYYCDLKELLTKKSENKEFWKEQFKDISDLSENLEVLTAKK